MPILKIREGAATRIREHGAEKYPHECCGALLGRDSDTKREVLDAIPLENRSEDSPRNRFSISPADVLAADRQAQERGLQLVGWYHSHPDHPALPSEHDLASAWPWYSYLIVSVQKGAAGAIASWRLAEDRNRFTPEEIRTAAGARV